MGEPKRRGTTTDPRPRPPHGHPSLSSKQLTGIAAHLDLEAALLASRCAVNNKEVRFAVCELSCQFLAIGIINALHHQPAQSATYEGVAREGSEGSGRGGNEWEGKPRVQHGTTMTEEWADTQKREAIDTSERGWKSVRQRGGREWRRTYEKKECEQTAGRTWAEGGQNEDRGQQNGGRGGERAEWQVEGGVSLKGEPKALRP